MAKVRYQHRIPQVEQDHDIVPKRKGQYLICTSCEKKIIIVPENDGPEGLKALFR